MVRVRKTVVDAEGKRPHRDHTSPKGKHRGHARKRTDRLDKICKIKQIEDRCLDED